MGEPVLILAFVTIVIGGIGSIKGAFIGAILVGLTQTLGSVFLPVLFSAVSGPGHGHVLGRILGQYGSLYIDEPCADLPPPPA